MDVLSCAILPASCHLCGNPLPRLSFLPVCEPCWADFPLRTGEVRAGGVCARCGDSLEWLRDRGNALNQTECRACRLAPPAFERAVAYGIYRGRMKTALHALKFERLMPIARRLGPMLAAAIAQLEGSAPSDMLVVPVPLYRLRRRERGFNQAETLAAEALKMLARTHPAWRLTLEPAALMRQRPTEPQMGLTPRERRLNLQGAFAVSEPGLVKGRHVLLLDDIMTSGATVRSASRVLKRAGAESVWVATLARARRMNAAHANAPGSKEYRYRDNAGHETQGQEGAQQDQPSF